MKRILTATLGLMLTFGTFSLAMAQKSFEGYIEFRKTNLVESAYYKYSVKGNKVRVDEFESQKDDQPIATLLVDLDKKEMLALSHERNLYMKREYKPYDPADPNSKVTKTSNFKEILGKRCEQWRVRNEAKKTDVTYWVTPGDYKFFPQLLEVMGRKDNFATFYQQLDGIEGVFPMNAIEYDLVRNVKGKLEVVNIQSQTMDATQFELPSSYLEVHN